MSTHVNTRQVGGLFNVNVDILMLGFADKIAWLMKSETDPNFAIFKTPS